MSGGHWNYMSQKLAERGTEAKELWRLMAVIEHELDWGICGDTCYACAAIRVVKALEAFFDTECDNASTAIDIAQDRRPPQNLCVKCAPK